MTDSKQCPFTRVASTIFTFSNVSIFEKIISNPASFTDGPIILIFYKEDRFSDIIPRTSFVHHSPTQRVYISFNEEKIFIMIES